MEELERYVNEQDFSKAICWIGENIENYEDISPVHELMDMALRFDDLCYDYLDSVWEYDECNRLMKEIIRLVVNVGLYI